MEPVLSVIIPVYKVEKYLPKCMESVQNQTLGRDMEIILVDDGSPDGCPAMCDAYAASDPRVKVVHKANGGLGYARNSGLDVATGRYVAFLDSDDWIEPQTYATAIELMERHDLDTVRFNCNRVTDSGEASPTDYSSPLVLFDTPGEMRLLTLGLFDTPTRAHERYEAGGSAWAGVYRRDIIENHELRFVSEREHISEDYLFNFDYYRHCRRAGYLPQTLHHYRITPGGLTRNLRLDCIDGVERYSRHVAGIFAGLGYGPEEHAYALGYYVRGLRANMRFIFLSDMPLAQKREWFMKEASREWLQSEVRRHYPISRLPLSQRILLKAQLAKQFWLCYMLIVGFTKLRKDKLK